MLLPTNYEEMSKVATEAGVALGVRRRRTRDELYDTLAALEKLGNKNLLFNACTASAQGGFRYQRFSSVRAAIKDGNRTCGYPSIVNVIGRSWRRGDARLSGGPAVPVHCEVRFHRHCR